MQADVEREVLAPALFVDSAHGFSHPHRSAQSPVRRREGRHHCVADCLDHRAALGRDRRQKFAEVVAHEIERGEIPDPVVERCRTPEIGKEDREAGDLEALFRIERAVPVEIAERLVAEEPVRGQNRPAAVREGKSVSTAYSIHNRPNFGSGLRRIQRLNPRNRSHCLMHILWSIMVRSTLIIKKKLAKRAGNCRI